MDFSEKVVIVTGGGSGIGADAARNFAKLGAKIAIVDRNEEGLNQVAEQMIGDGLLKPLTIFADVTKDACQIIDETISHFGRLDILVNCAGIGSFDSVIDFSVDEFDRVLNVNLKSLMVLTKLAVPHLESTKGNVINVSSILSMAAAGNNTSYSISKAGVDQFTKCAAITLAHKGIRVNAINPGIIKTPIYDAFGGDQYSEQFKGLYLVGRLGSVLDTSSAIAFLASNTFMTGILLPVDGGSLANGTAGKRNDFQR